MSVSSFFNNTGDGAKQLSDFVYPFKANGVHRIFIWLDFEKREPAATATVYFKMKNTSGEHKIEAPTLEQLLPRIKSFLEEIDK